MWVCPTLTSQLPLQRPANEVHPRPLSLGRLRRDVTTGAGEGPKASGAAMGVRAEPEPRSPPSPGLPPATETASPTPASVTASLSRVTPEHTSSEILNATWAS